jgi:hypothetical protein
MLIFEVDGTQSDHMVHYYVEPSAGHQRQKSPMRLLERQSDPAHARQEFAIRFQPVCVQQADPQTAKVVGLGNLFVAVEAQKARLTLKADPPLRMHVGIEEAADQIALAVDSLKARDPCPERNISARTDSGGNHLRMATGKSQGNRNHNGCGEAHHCVTTSVMVWVCEMPEV